SGIIARLDVSSYDMKCHLPRSTAWSAVALCAWLCQPVLRIEGSGSIDRFLWSDIASPQQAGQPFAVRITALDTNNTVVTNFAGPVILTGAVGSGVESFPILGNLTYQDFSYNQNGPVSAGYSFTPDADLLATHARHYSGGRVSIWTEDGVLLTARDVADFGGFPGAWRETPLLLPLVLYAGNTYRVTIWSESNRYYWRNASVTAFPNGLIGPSYGANT